MVSERYFKLSIWSPVAVVAMCFAGTMLAQVLRARLMGNIVGIVFVSALIWGIPYVVFAVLLSLLLRRAPVRKLQIVSLFTPLAFAAFLCLFLVVQSYFGLGFSGDGLFFFPLYYAGWAIGVGYAYLALVHIVFFALKSLGVFNVPQKAA